MIKKQLAKSGGQILPRVTQYDVDDYNDEEEDCETLNSKGGGSGKLAKRPRKMGQVDMYFTPSREDAIKRRKNGNEGMQRGNCDEESRDKVCKDIARWFYDAGIPFSAANYESFGEMIESIGQYGPGLKPPSVHELEAPLLQKEVDDILKQMEEHKKEWAQKGCSIIVDGWHDSVAEKDFVNFLVNSSKGSVFIKSIDVSEIVEDVNSLFQMLEDIGKITKVKDALKKCNFINDYINSHVSLVNMMRRFTNQGILCRPTIARFASSFITLAQFHKQRNNLKKMVKSQEWNVSNWPKEVGAKKVASFILQDTFWENVVYALKLLGPLIKILRMLDQEKKPSMGYIYEAMDRAKEAIANSFTTEEHYKKAFEYIDERWNCQLHRPLHVAGYFLNPELHYDNPDVSGCEEVMKGFLDCLTRLVPELDLQDKISFELDAYRNASSLFGLPIAVRQRKTKPPVEWWFTYGCSTPNLQKFAMRVLSLTCSAIGCERNWDGFQLLHANKKNKLAQGRLDDLVFVKFNRALHCRYNRKDAAKSNLLEEIDDCNEWLLGKMDENSCADEDNFVFDGDNSNWGAVGGVVGTCDPSHVTAASRMVRHGSKLSSFKANRGKGHASSSSHKKSIRMMTSDDEDEMEEDIGVDDVYVDDSDEYVDLSFEELTSDAPRQKVKSSANPIASDTPCPSDLQLQGTSNHLRRSPRHKAQRLRRF